jgi:hypothetical protein
MVDAWKETEREKETRSQSYTEKVIEFSMNQMKIIQSCLMWTWKIWPQNVAYFKVCFGNSGLNKANVLVCVDPKYKALLVCSFKFRCLCMYWIWRSSLLHTWYTEKVIEFSMNQMKIIQSCLMWTWKIWPQNGVVVH